MEKRRKTRIRRRNGGVKRIILVLIAIFILIQIFIKIIAPASVTFSRYIYKVARNFYFNSVNFYFNSDKLDEDGSAKFEADNWSGADEYSVTINMNSKKNISELTKYNIDYTIKAEWGVYNSDGVKYTEDLIRFEIADVNENDYDSNLGITKTITSTDNGGNNTNTFDFSINLEPNKTLQNGDYVFVKIDATSITNYTKKLSGTFKIIVGKPGMSYQIEDKSYNPYVNVIVTNTRDYYTVDTAFGTYLEGSTITIAEYLGLTEEQKKNCHSMDITLNFNPEDVVLDTASVAYLDAKKENLITYTNIIENTTIFDEATNSNIEQSNEYQYVNSIRFKLDAEESKVIKFYKKIASKDYTYPNITGEGPVVNVISD